MESDHVLEIEKLKGIVKQQFYEFFQYSFFVILERRKLYPDGTFTLHNNRSFSQSLPVPVHDGLREYVETFCKKLTTFLFNGILMGALLEISQKINLHERYFFRLNGTSSKKFIEEFNQTPTLDKLLGLTNLLKEALLKINSFRYEALSDSQKYEWNISLGMVNGSYKDDNLLGPFKGDPDWNNFPWRRFGHKAIYKTLQSSVEQLPGLPKSHKKKATEKYSKRIKYSAENVTLTGICSVELSEEYTLDFYKLEYLKYSI